MVIDFVKRALASPWAGAYSFILLFLFALLTGESDLMSFLYSRVFPRSDSFGAVRIPLSPILDHASSGAAGAPRAQQLLLLRHDIDQVESINIFRKGGAGHPILALGSVGGTAIYNPRLQAVIEPLLLMNLEVPPASLVAIVSDESSLTARGKLYFTSGITEKDFNEDGGLMMQTNNESRNLRVLYGLAIVCAAMLGTTLARTGRLKYPDSK